MALRASQAVRARDVMVNGRNGSKIFVLLFI